VLDAAVRKRVLVIARGSDLRTAAGERLVTRVDDADVVLLQPDAVLDDGRLVAPAAPPPGIPLVVIESPPWDRWTDSVAPPLDGRAVLVTR
jgi:hypothetical protein